MNPSIRFSQGDRATVSVHNFVLKNGVTYLAYQALRRRFTRFLHTQGMALVDTDSNPLSVVKPDHPLQASDRLKVFDWMAEQPMCRYLQSFFEEHAPAGTVQITFMHWDQRVVCAHAWQMSAVTPYVSPTNPLDIPFGESVLDVVP